MERPKSPADSAVRPSQMIGWLLSVLESGGVIDVDAWNDAVDALTGTDRV